MTAQPVEWVLVVYYGPSAHRATYGRLEGTTYTKDYIQLSRTEDFTAALASLFPTDGAGAIVPLTYKWPLGTAAGQLVFHSADRPHLAWETRLGAPGAWRMSLTPREDTPETIPGDPTHRDVQMAERELALLSERGAGQPYLVAVKLFGEPRTLHLRAYLANPSENYAWANSEFLPNEIQTLTTRASRTSALAWLTASSGGIMPDSEVAAALELLAATGNYKSALDSLGAGTCRALADYLEHPGYGLFFDPIRNHDAWLQPAPLPGKVAEEVDVLLSDLRSRFPPSPQGDAAAEALDSASSEVEAFRTQIADGNYDVPDAYATVKTRGSAQRAFSEAVRKNYDYRCAVTGIDTKEFLVAAHIVPWSEDHTIRLDPSNGICLSLLMDRALEDGFIVLEDDLTVVVIWTRVGDDISLRSYLEAYDGKKLNVPKNDAPKVEYIRRRRKLTN